MTNLPIVTLAAPRTTVLAAAVVRGHRRASTMRAVVGRDPRGRQFGDDMVGTSAVREGRPRAHEEARVAFRRSSPSWTLGSSCRESDSALKNTSSSRLSAAKVPTLLSSRGMQPNARPATIPNSTRVPDASHLVRVEVVGGEGVYREVV